MLNKIKQKFKCFIKNDHDYVYNGNTLGGDWIVCLKCGHVEEYLPGLHEPKGYRDDDKTL